MPLKIAPRPDIPYKGEQQQFDENYRCEIVKEVIEMPINSEHFDGDDYSVCLAGVGTEMSVHDKDNNELEFELLVKMKDKVWNGTEFNEAISYQPWTDIMHIFTTRRSSEFASLDKTYVNYGDFSRCVGLVVKVKSGIPHKLVYTRINIRMTSIKDDAVTYMRYAS